MILKDKRRKAEIELVASMYDASLDAFRANSWYFNIYQSYYSRLYWTSSLARVANSTEFNEQSNDYHHSLPSRYYDVLNYFGLGFYNNYYYRGYGEGLEEVLEEHMMELWLKKCLLWLTKYYKQKSAPAPKNDG